MKQLDLFAWRQLPRFFLGMHNVAALGRMTVPLFVSRRRLAGRATYPRALAPWALDSGGFTEIQLFGQWTISAAQYAGEVLKFRDAIGSMVWAAPQDWMCEPQVISGLAQRRKTTYCRKCLDSGTKSAMHTARLHDDESPELKCGACGHTERGKRPQINVAKWRAWAVNAGDVMRQALADADRYGIDAVVIFHGTGLSVEEHQRRTVTNLLELRQLAASVQWAPVLQGWMLDDYLRHVAMYKEAGIDLAAEPVVGVGSVCRRQGTKETRRIFEALHALGIRLHGFGVKTTGLPKLAPYIVSADSLAWSLDARRAAPLPGHTHKNCANCDEYALAWRSKVLATLS